MKWLIILLTLSFLTFCSPKGPQTFYSPHVGKTKDDLIAIKGVAKEIQVYGTNEVYIYKTREEYFGNKKQKNTGVSHIPKKVYEIEAIYYINEKGYIYKYQSWKKRID